MNAISDLSKLPVIAPNPTPRPKAQPQVAADRRAQERRGPSRKILRSAGESERRRRDRRATVRVEVELDCEERHAGTRYFRVTRDLSTFGVSTRGGSKREVGTRVELRLYLPDDLSRPIHVQAEVVGHHPAAGMRLAFRNPPAEAVRRIHRYLRAQAKAQR